MAAKKRERDGMIALHPMSPSQERVFSSWADEKNLLMLGSAGTGKTLLGLYLGLKSVVNSEHSQLIIARSAVPTRSLGFMPGDEEEKAAVYETPYEDMVDFLYPESKNVYKLLKGDGRIRFLTTSYARGVTWHDSVLLIDEAQSMNLHELDTLMTRLGDDSRVIVCGDHGQCDLRGPYDRSGLPEFREILGRMSSFEEIEFSWRDVVRSGLVKEYLSAKEAVDVGPKAG